MCLNVVKAFWNLLSVSDYLTKIYVQHQVAVSECKKI